MSATLAQLQERKDQLLLRMESLQKRVTHGDKSVEYDLSLAWQALQNLNREIGRVEGNRPVRHLRVSSAKDL